MSTDEAYAAFKAIRFADSGGEPICPECACDTIYALKRGGVFRCKACVKEFTLTSGTIFASRKMSLRDILTAIALFVNGVDGVAALRLSRELNCDYKTAFVLEHKLREVLGAMRAQHKLTGVVEIDGAWVGGHIKPMNIGNKREDRRKQNNGKRRSVVTMRERGRGGRSLSFVFKGENESIATVLAHVHESAMVITDEGTHWNVLAGYFDTRQVNHSKEYSQRNGVHTNIVESFNSRLRRLERGVHHRISGSYLQNYADEVGWREDYRRSSNGQQFAMIVGAAARQPISRNWKGYWQRRGPRLTSPLPPHGPPRPSSNVVAFRPRS